MKQSLRKTLLSVLISVGALAMVFALAMFTACEPTATEHTLTFVLNGGTGTEEVKAAAGDSISVADPTYAGHEFDGWYLDENFNGEKQTIPTEMPDEDRTYYAKWTQLPQITLQLNGGALAGVTGNLYLKAGEDLYAFMQQYNPTKTGFEFGAWYNDGLELVENYPMPAAGITLDAWWKAPYSVKVFKYDFLNYDYVEDESLAATAYAYDGTVVDGSELGFEGYTVSSATVPVEVSETEVVELKVYLVANYTEYYDAFGGSDYLYTFENEPDAVYLERLGAGRVKCAEYNPDTKVFKFELKLETAEGEAAAQAEEVTVLEGKLAGTVGSSQDSYFYYFKDTLANEYKAYDGSGATLNIVDYNNVTFTDDKGVETKGGYDVNLDTGRFEFIPASGESFEFAFMSVDGEVYFRTYDGVEGTYMYGSADSWVLMYFDGFGYAEYLDDTGTHYQVSYDLVAGTTDVVSVPELEVVVKVTKDPAIPPIGSLNIDGTFALQDSYAGMYVENNMYTNIPKYIELDGFGKATYYETIYNAEAGPDEDEYTVKATDYGTYVIGHDDPWYARGYSETYGSVIMTYYGNSWLEFTNSAGSTTNYLLSYEYDDYGAITERLFDEYNVEDFDIAPGRYELTGDHFTLEGTDYPLDSTHVAFVYASNTFDGGNQAGSLWYGTYSDAVKDFVYTLYFSGTWYDETNLYNYEDYDSGIDLYFTVNEDGTYTFEREDYDGEPYMLVFLADETLGGLYIDGAGTAYYAPECDLSQQYKVEYEVIETGLLYVFEFSNLPHNVPTLYGAFEYQTYTGEIISETYVLDTVYENVETQLTQDDSGQTVETYITTKLVVTEERAFLGAQFTDGSIYYVLAGNVTPVDESEDEFNFVMDESIYWDELDYIQGSEDLLAAYSEFRYKVNAEDNSFLFYDGMEYTLEGPNGGSFVSDGYGNATLIVKDSSGGQQQYTGTYSRYGSLIEFMYGQGGDDGFLLKPDNLESPKSYTFINTEEADLIGVLQEAVMMYGKFYYGSSAVFFDGEGGLLFEEAVEDENGDVVYRTYTGTYVLPPEDEWVVFQLGDSNVGLEMQITIGEDDTRTIALILTADGRLTGLFIQRSDACMGEYNVYDDAGNSIGQITGGDGYNVYDSELFLAYGDGEDDFELGVGYMAKGTLDAQYYNSRPTFAEDPNGNVIIFMPLDEDGSATTQYVFDIDSKDPTKVVMRSLYYGTVAEYKNGQLTGRYMRLDGHGKAQIYDSADQFVMSGEYWVEGTSSSGSTIYYGFDNKASGNQHEAFIFTAESITNSTSITYLYVPYSEEDGIYVNADWSVLYLDGFYTGMYIDKYGMTYTGEYVHVIDSYYYLTITSGTSRVRLYFGLNEDGTFTLLENDFLVIDHVLYVYLGSSETINIPDEVTTIAGGAFSLAGARYATSINFNNVTTIQDKAFYYFLGEVTEISSDKIITVGADAFNHMTYLESVYLPKVKSIGANAFNGCVSLTDVVLGEIEEIGANAFTRSIALSDSLPLNLDLTACKNPAAISIDPTAFQAMRGALGLVEEVVFSTNSGSGYIAVSGGIETLNAILESESFKPQDKAWADLTPYVALAAEDASFDTLVFFDFESGKMAYFSYFEFGVYAPEQDYFGDVVFSPESTAVYYEAEDKVIVYHYDAEQQKYVKDAELDLSSSELTLNGVKYYRATAWDDAEDRVITFTADDNKSLEFAYEVNAVDGFGGMEVTLTFKSAKYDGKDAVDFAYDLDAYQFTFVADNYSYTATLSQGKLSVTNNGKMYVLFDKTNDSIYFKATFGEDNGVYTLKELAYLSSPSWNTDWSTVSDYTKADDSYTYTFTISQVSYTMVFTPGQDSVEGSIKVTNEGQEYSSYNADGANHSVLATVKMDGSKIVEVKSIGDYSDRNWTISKVTISNDGSYAYVETQDHGNYYVVYSYTIYIYAENYYVSNSDYRIMFKLSLNEDKSIKLDEFKELLKYNTDTYQYDEKVETTGSTKNADGSYDINLADGKTLHVVITESYGYYSITVTEKEAA